ncbi:LacI family DNA-binding transcriptional regulator [Lutibacter flavus]|uniref:Transcriptional regulator, LacI family n=1 Tax=Lutibacter flavus TaxID=691689 RepID=A0A238XCU0_9FLAO|nr:LacI family DNA-binding transcriptional regulator [Lutibacter flavus]SNR56134.1 transcriptional regulator, LacI family [Lutibacter flavus]
MKPTTLKDIAHELNISVATVSKALKGYSDVSSSTKKAVLKMAKKMNYIPNTVAVNLRTQQTKTLGVIIPAIVHHFFSEVMDGIIKEAKKHGYLVITLQSNENYQLEKKQLILLQQKRVDGILISLSNDTPNFDHINAILQKKIPIVMFDKIAKLVECSKVVIDDKLAAYNAVSYLIEKGYKRIAHFRGSLNPQISIDRFLGYRKALVDHGIPFDPKLVYICDNNDDFNDGYNNAKKMLEEHNDIDAVFTITDVVAVGILKYLKENDIKIPEDIALFGFSNWFMSSVITPSLSSVTQPGFKMGKKSTKILIEEIKCINKGIPYSFQTCVLPTSLVIRNSS